MGNQIKEAAGTLQNRCSALFEPRLLCSFAAALLAFWPGQASGAERKILTGHVPAITKTAVAGGRLAPDTELHLALGLPLRNTAALTNLLKDLYDPASPNYRHYLTPEEFTATFGPTEQDYAAVSEFARTNGLAISGTHPNRLLLDVAGRAADIERAFSIKLVTYRHPTENRTFFAPDTEPSVRADLRLNDVCGLNNYGRPKPMSLHAVSTLAPLTIAFGSAPDGGFMGSDFRNAYLPGVTWDGAGQSVGLMEFATYSANDIHSYENMNGITNVPLQNVQVGAGSATYNDGSDEATLDIEVTIAMAPGLASVIVYEADLDTSYFNDILNRMVSDNKAKQLSSSWTPLDQPSSTRDQIFQQMAAQGQSFFQASGDDGAASGPVIQPSDNPFITVVGGTTLTTSGPGGSWVSESAWRGSSGITGGGISTYYSLPAWQQDIDMTLNGGSTTMRNAPDVSMVAENVYAVYRLGRHASFGGTSISSPLWAALTALLNQHAAAYNLPPVGFLNPAIYALAKSSKYGADFHDVATGDNITDLSPYLFYCVKGFDLCTGWGTPKAPSLLDDLAFGPAALAISPLSGFIATGPVGGPFSIQARNYTLANSGRLGLSWSVGKNVNWLSALPAGGTLASGGDTANLTVALNPNATSLLDGTYVGKIWITNENFNSSQSLQFTLTVGSGTSSDAQGALQVLMQPSYVVHAGAAWQVDAGAWQTNASIVPLGSGTHTLQFSYVHGWGTPPAQLVTIAAGQTNVVTATYGTGSGSFKVTASASPAAAGKVSGVGSFKAESIRTVRAVAANNYAFSSWTENGVVLTNSSTYSFPLYGNRALVANFVTNPFVSVQGNYSGLFVSTNANSAATMGLCGFKLTAKGAYSGSLLWMGNRASLSGQLNSSGKDTRQIKAGSAGTLTVSLQVDLSGQSDVLSGNISSGTWSAPLLGHRAHYDGRLSIAPQAALYTVVIPGTNGSSTLPGGDSYATVTVDKAGGIKLSAMLADGTKLTQAAAISGDGAWPMFGSANSHSALAGWLYFPGTPAAGFSGRLTWTDLASGAAKYYKSGFVYESDAQGSFYGAPPGEANVLTLTSGTLTLSGGGLAAGITNQLSFGVHNKVTGTSPSKLTFSFSVFSGLFKGSITDPANPKSKAIPFTGVVRQGVNAARGFFLGAGESGEVTLDPAP